MASSLDALSKLRENKIIYLRLANSAQWGKSRVEMALGRYLYVAHPMEKDNLLKVKEKQNLEIGFTSENEFWTFFSIVLEVRRKPLPLLVLQRPTVNEVVRVQRRRSERVETLVPLTFEFSYGRVVSPPRHTLALNLSSTGLSFNDSVPISSGSQIQMEIQLPNITAGFSVSGETVACSRVLGSNAERYKIRVRFISIAPVTRQRLEDFVKWKREEQKKLE